MTSEHFFYSFLKSEEFLTHKKNISHLCSSYHCDGNLYKRFWWLKGVERSPGPSVFTCTLCASVGWHTVLKTSTHQGCQGSHPQPSQYVTPLRKPAEQEDKMLTQLPCPSGTLWETELNWDWCSLASSRFPEEWNHPFSTKTPHLQPPWPKLPPQPQLSTAWKVESSRNLVWPTEDFISSQGVCSGHFVFVFCVVFFFGQGPCTDGATGCVLPTWGDGGCQVQRVHDQGHSSGRTFDPRMYRIRKCHL